jgi:hypothetical protein
MAERVSPPLRGGFRHRRELQRWSSLRVYGFRMCASNGLRRTKHRRLSDIQLRWRSSRELAEP